MTAQAPGLHRAIAVLAPPRRFQLLLLLLAGPDRSVSQLARAVRLSQSCTTRHLQSLARAGLVKRERDGKRVVFHPAPRDASARALIASLAGMVGLATGSRLDPVLAAGMSLGAIPIGSAAELEPLGERRERVRAGRPARPPRARPVQAQPPPAPEVTQEEPESAINSASPPPAPWRRSEIEDFLL